MEFRRVLFRSIEKNLDNKPKEENLEDIEKEQDKNEINKKDDENIQQEIEVITKKEDIAEKEVESINQKEEIINKTEIIEKEEQKENQTQADLDKEKSEKTEDVNINKSNEGENIFENTEEKSDIAITSMNIMDELRPSNVFEEDKTNINKPEDNNLFSVEDKHEEGKEVNIEDNYPKETKEEITIPLNTIEDQENNNNDLPIDNEETKIPGNDYKNEAMNYVDPNSDSIIEDAAIFGMEYFLGENSIPENISKLANSLNEYTDEMIEAKKRDPSINIKNKFELEKIEEEPQESQEPISSVPESSLSAPVHRRALT